MKAILLSERAGKILAVLLQILCAVLFLVTLYHCIRVWFGYAEINLTTQELMHERVSLRGEIQQQVSYILLPDEIHLTAMNGIAAITWIGISLMGMLRFLPYAFCYFMFILFFRNIAKKKIFITQNEDILLYCGVVLLLASMLVPVINGYAIPALINALTDNVIGVGVNLLSDPRPTQGIVLLVAAYVLRYGINMQNEADKKL